MKVQPARDPVNWGRTDAAFPPNSYRRIISLDQAAHLPLCREKRKTMSLIDSIASIGTLVLMVVVIFGSTKLFTKD